MKIGFYGDLFEDVFTEVREIKTNPESGCPVYVIDDHGNSYAGGVGNAARTLEHFGVESILFADQQFAEIKRRLIYQGKQLCRVDLDGRGYRPSFPTYRDRMCEQLLATSDLRAIVVSDYGRGMVTKETLGKIAGRARQLQIPCVIDTKRSWGVLNSFCVLKPNLAEALAMTAMEDPARAANSLRLWHNCPVVVTRGARPPIVVDQNGDMFCHDEIKFPAMPFQASGAGDWFAAFLARGLAVNHTLELAARMAHWRAAAAGFFPPFRAPLFPWELLGLDDPLNNKLLAQDHLAGWLKRRTRGTLCVANGCFDLLHAGHINFLRECRAQADNLLVLVNSDDSVRSIKGHARPIVKLSDRMQSLAALSFVSAVTPFDETTPTELLSQLAACRPIDVLAKGPEYRGRPVQGSSFARRVHFSQNYGPHSSDIFARIKRADW
jgi:D-beta-D-heptose 7-phosphate kinase/D-beta-D-heptose 1-phosphate adenosyltransferase